MLRFVTSVFIVLVFCFSTGDSLRPPRRRTAPNVNVKADSPAETVELLPEEEIFVETKAEDSPIFEPEISVETELIPSRRKLLQRRGRKPPSERRRHGAAAEAQPKLKSPTPAFRRAPSRRKQANPKPEPELESTRPPRTNRPPFRQRTSTSRKSPLEQPEIAETEASSPDVVSQRFVNKRRNRPFPRTRAPSSSSAFRDTENAKPSSDRLLTDLTRLEKIERNTLTQRHRAKPTDNLQTVVFSSPKTSRPGPRRKASIVQTSIKPQSIRVTTEKTITQTSPPELPGLPDYETECPEKNGLFADAFQCDRYYECSNFQLKEKLCPDGLVFNDFSTVLGRCDFMHAVNCSGREQLQPAHPVGLCPRRNGYYPDADPAVCDRFVQCVGGKANPLVCPAGLVFSLKTGTCLWPDQAGRTGCGSKEVLQFQCPYKKPIDIRSLLPGQPLHPRFPDPSDCQYFITCIEGAVPRRHGCQRGQVFNAENSSCDSPENVPKCNGSLEETVQ